MNGQMLVATRKGLLQLARKNGGWSVERTSFAGIPVTAALHDARDGTLYAMLKHGHFGAKLHRSDDEGRSWTELAAPAFPADAAGSPTLFQIWTLEAGGAAEPGRLWAGALPAGLFVSSDRGEHWQHVGALWNVPEREKWFGGGYDDAGIHTISPDPRDPKRVFVAISCGGVWDSADGGQSWRLRGDGMVATYMPPGIGGTEGNAGPAPGGALRCRARHDVDAAPLRHLPLDRRRRDLDAAQTAGGRFRLRGGGASEGPADRLVRPAIKDELRVPRDGALAVTRTRDGGRTFESFRDGLPQRDAFDLVYRHGLDVDEAGTRLAMGSTTGSLWVSDNAGEAWQLVNAHLPPIYAVRLT